MGDIGSCGDPSFQDFDHKSRKSNSFHGQVFIGSDHLNCSNEEIITMDLLLEDLDISSDEDLNDFLLEELENLHVKKAICSSISNQKISQFSFHNTSQLKDLSKCAAILGSEVLQSRPSIFAKSELSTVKLGCESSVSASNPAEDSLMPCHVPLKFVSALKGSRARQGKLLDPNLHVTWEANVYEPPVSLSSHTVKGHRHRLPKAKKDHHKHKHKHKQIKGKLSNGSSCDRKHSQRSSSSSSRLLDPRMARLQSLAARSLQTGFGRSKVHTLDKFSGQEFKCGSPWPLPLPVARLSE